MNTNIITQGLAKVGGPEFKTSFAVIKEDIGSNITGVAGGQVWSRILVAARRSIVIGALGAAALLGRALPVEAVALPQHPCTPALEQLLAEWDAAGLEMQPKPGQMIVHGRNGRVSSGPEATYMTNQIRQA